MKLFECESTARDREKKSPAEARAQHYVIMIAGPRKMKGHLMQPLEKVSFLIVQHRWEQYYLKWGGLKQEWNEWKERQFLAEYVSFPSHSKGMAFISHNCNTYGGEDVLQNQEYGELSLWKLRKAARKWDYSHNITLADKRKSHCEQTGNETRKQVPELFLWV